MVRYTLHFALRKTQGAVACTHHERKENKPIIKAFFKTTRTNIPDLKKRSILPRMVSVRRSPYPAKLLAKTDWRRWMYRTILFTFITTTTLLPAITRFSIMLAPAGDAKHTGRQIGDSLERGITLQCAEQLKKMLQDLYPNVRVALTRSPGETIYPLQNANFSNRLGDDCYVSIHFYPESRTKPQMFMYYFSYGDDFVTKTPDLFFCPYDQAHRINGPKTRSWSQLVAQVLTNEKHKKLFDFRNICGVPFKPLIGVKAPAFAFEIGLQEKNDWKRYVEPIALSIGQIVQANLETA